MSPATAEHRRIELNVVAYDGDAVQWNNFVKTCDESTLAHHAGWRSIMTDVFGLECCYRVVRDSEGHYCGALPLVRMRSRLLGHYLISLPFINYGGPIGSVAAQRLLTEHAIDEARRSGAEVVEFRSAHSVAPGLTPGRAKITVLLNLPKTVDQLWNERFGSKLRSQIRRAQKQRMVTCFGGNEVGAFHEVFSRNMRDLGTPAHPLSFFERLANSFDDEVVFGVVYDGLVPVAAGCGFIWRNEFEMNWASSLRAYNRHSPNMLLYWSFMEAMIERGVCTFNFGRCTPGSSTHQFKRQWGGRDVPLSWGQWSRNQRSAIPSQASLAARIVPRVWRRLPLPIANRLGPLLSRRIATF